MVILPIMLALAPASDKVASEAENQAAFNAYFSCFDANASGYDDGRSDAQTIALAIIPLCDRQRDALAEVMNRGKPSRFLRLARATIDRQAISVATAAVLKARRAAATPH